MMISAAELVAQNGHLLCQIADVTKGNTTEVTLTLIAVSFGFRAGASSPSASGGSNPLMAPSLSGLGGASALGAGGGGAAGGSATSTWGSSGALPPLGSSDSGSLPPMAQLRVDSFPPAPGASAAAVGPSAGSGLGTSSARGRRSGLSNVGLGDGSDMLADFGYGEPAAFSCSARGGGGGGRGGPSNSGGAASGSASGSQQRRRTGLVGLATDMMEEYGYGSDGAGPSGHTRRPASGASGGALP